MTDPSPSIRVVWYIPAMLRNNSNGQSEIEFDIQTPTYQQAFKYLVELYPGFAEHFDVESARPRSYLSIFHNNEQLTDFSAATFLRDRDEILIVPALAGG